MVTIGKSSQQQQLSDDSAPKRNLEAITDTFKATTPERAAEILRKTKGRAGRRKPAKSKKQSPKPARQPFDPVVLHSDPHTGSDFDSMCESAMSTSTDDFERWSQGQSIQNEAMARIRSKYAEMCVAYQKSEGMREHACELNTQLGLKISDLEEEIARLKQEKLDMSNEMLNDKERIREIQDKNTTLLAKISELEREILLKHECTEKLLKDKDALLKDKDAKLEIAREECVKLQTEKATALGQLAESKHNFTILIAEKDELRAEKEELSREVVSNNTALASLQKELEAEKVVANDTSSNLEQLRAENDEHVSEKAALNTHITHLTAQNKGLDSRLLEKVNEHGEAKGKLEHRVAQLTANNRELKEKYDKKKVDLEQKREGESRALQAVEERDRLLKDNQARHKSQTAELERLRQLLAKADLSIHQLKTELKESVKELASADARHDKQKHVINTHKDNFTAEHHKNLELHDRIKQLEIVNNGLREERDKLRKSDLGVQARKRNTVHGFGSSWNDFQKHRQSSLEVPMRETESLSPILSSNENSRDPSPVSSRNAEGRVAKTHC